MLSEEVGLKVTKVIMDVGASTSMAEASSYSFRTNRRKSWNLNSFHRSTESHEVIAEYFNAVMKRIVSDFVRKLGEKVFQSKDKFVSQFEGSLMKIRGRLNINPNYTTVEVVLKNFLEDISELKDYFPLHTEISEEEKTLISEKATGIKSLVPAILQFYVKMFEQSAIIKDGAKFQSTVDQIYAEVKDLQPAFNEEMKVFCSKQSIDIIAIMVNPKDNPLLKLDMNPKSDETINYIREFFDGEKKILETENNNLVPHLVEKLADEEQYFTADEGNGKEDGSNSSSKMHHLSVEETNITLPSAEVSEPSSILETNKTNGSAKKKTPASRRKRKVEELNESIELEPTINESQDICNQLEMDVAEETTVKSGTKLEETTQTIEESTVNPLSPKAPSSTNKRKKGKKSIEGSVVETMISIEINESQYVTASASATATVTTTSVEQVVDNNLLHSALYPNEEPIEEAQPQSATKVTSRGKSKRKSKNNSDKLEMTDLVVEETVLRPLEPMEATTEKDSLEVQESTISNEEVVPKSVEQPKKRGGKKKKDVDSSTPIITNSSIEPLPNNEPVLPVELQTPEADISKEINDTILNNSFVDPIESIAVPTAVILENTSSKSKSRKRKLNCNEVEELELQDEAVGKPDLELPSKDDAPPTNDMTEDVNETSMENNEDFLSESISATNENISTQPNNSDHTVVKKRGGRKRKADSLPVINAESNLSTERKTVETIAEPVLHSTEELPVGNIPKSSKKRGGKKKNDTSNISGEEVPEISVHDDVVPEMQSNEDANLIEETTLQDSAITEDEQPILSPAIPTFRELISSTFESPQQLANKMRLSFRRFVAPSLQDIAADVGKAVDDSKNSNAVAIEMATDDIIAKENDLILGDESMLDVSMDGPLLESVSELNSTPTSKRLGKGKRGKRMKTDPASDIVTAHGEVKIVIDGTEDFRNDVNETDQVLPGFDQTKKRQGRPKNVVATVSSNRPCTSELIKEYFPAMKRPRRNRIILEDEDDSESDSNSENDNDDEENEDLILFSKEDVEKLLKGVLAIQQGCALMNTWLQLQS